MGEPGIGEPHDLQAFVAELGAGPNAVGEPVYRVQERLIARTHAYGSRSARITAFPTFMMVSMGRGEPATVELTTLLALTPRLDQIAALDNLVEQAERGLVPPADGLRMLEEIRDMRPRFGRVKGIVGYSVFSLGLCLILHPAPRDVASAAVLGRLVGWLRSIEWRQSPIHVLMPVIAAFAVSALSALAVRGGAHRDRSAARWSRRSWSSSPEPH